MKNKSFPYNDEINISDIFRRLYKEKFLILFFTIIFGLISFLIPNSSEHLKNKKVIFVITDKSDLLEDYYLYLGSNDPLYNFNIQFQSELLKFENMSNFINNDKDFEKFQKYFKQIKSNPRKYFGERFGQLTHQNKIIHNQYFFFQSEIYTNTFIKNYIDFVKKKTLLQIKKFAQNDLKYKLNRNKAILKKIGTNLDYQYLNYNTEITELETLLKQLENLEIEDDVIYYMDNTDLLSTSPKLLKLNLLLGLIIGFFISLTIIFFKKNF